MFSCYVSSVSHPFVFFCKQKTAYEMRISESSDVCSSDLRRSICGSHAAADQQLFRRRCRRPCVAGAAQLREPGRCHGRCRSEERRVGKEWVRPCSSRRSPYQQKQKRTQHTLRTHTICTECRRPRIMPVREQ